MFLRFSRHVLLEGSKGIHQFVFDSSYQVLNLGDISLLSYQMIQVIDVSKIGFLCQIEVDKGLHLFSLQSHVSIDHLYLLFNFLDPSLKFILCTPVKLFVDHSASVAARKYVAELMSIWFHFDCAN